MRSVDRAKAYFFWHLGAACFIPLATMLIQTFLFKDAASLNGFLYGIQTFPPTIIFLALQTLLLFLASLIVHLTLHFLRLAKYFWLILGSGLAATWLFMATGTALLLNLLVLEVLALIKLNEYWDEQDALKFRRESFVH